MLARCEVHLSAEKASRHREGERERGREREGEREREREFFILVYIGLYVSYIGFIWFLIGFIRFYTGSYIYIYINAQMIVCYDVHLIKT